MSIHILRIRFYCQSVLESYNAENVSTVDRRISRDIFSSTTYAVRGATIARPHPNPRRYRLRHDQRAKAVNGDLNNFHSNPFFRRKVRLEQMYEFLPRTVLERATHPAYSNHDQGQRNNQAVQDIKDSVKSLEQRPRLMAVQFLNANKTRAVCFKTPPFACGTVTQPITIFLVGIATEDGVFISGLEQRMEIGHMYPESCVSGSVRQSGLSQGLWTASDLSNVCMSTDSTATPLSNTPVASSNPILIKDVDQDAPPETGESSPNFARASHDAEGRGRIGGGSCGLSTSNASKYSGSTDIMIFDSSEDDEDGHLSQDDGNDDESSSSSSMSVEIHEDEIVRGRTGPGRWHCYTAIFNGPNSELRVDGLRENNLNSSSPLNLTTGGMLDGLTLGSDHRFHLSLCCGGDEDGMGALSDGEGEGAIAELAVFKGHLPAEDVIAIESHLMSKHGLPRAKPSNWIFEDQERHVHTLMCRPPGWEPTDASCSSADMTPPSIPLSFAAQHSSVSWYRENPVTGVALSIKRIGCRPGNESSDW